MASPEQLQLETTTKGEHNPGPRNVIPCGNDTLLLESSTRTERPQEDGGYPDGGMQAWLVVLGAWCAMIPSMGLLNTIGVLHAWMAEHQLQGYSESNIGWIVSAYAFFLYIGGAQVGKCVATQIHA